MAETEPPREKRSTNPAAIILALGALGLLLVLLFFQSSGRRPAPEQGRSRWLS
jgi:hypothetical protein